MLSHKFKVRDIVAIGRAISRNAPGGVFEVIKQLPGSHEPEYRIKTARAGPHNEHRRCARQSEHSRCRDTMSAIEPLLEDTPEAALAIDLCRQ